jgi:hypothetical protein
MVTPRLQVSLAPDCSCRFTFIWKETQADIIHVEGLYSDMFAVNDMTETVTTLIKYRNQGVGREHDPLPVVLL